MLTHIDITHFAIVDSLTIDFTEGLSVLTGETGAGKSLWVDALSLALGQRGDPQWIRSGQERADISVTFDIRHQPDVIAWLNHEEITHDNECLIRRTLSRQGNTRCTINGTPFPLQRVRELADLLIQIHGQHQQQQLLQNDRQRSCLDHFSGNQTLLKNLNTIFQEWHDLHNELNELTRHLGDRNQKIDFLRYQIDELNFLQLKEGEWQSLSLKHQQHHHAKELIQQLNEALTLTVEHEDISAAHLIQQALHHISSIKITDPQLESIRELLNVAAVYLNEAGDELQAYRDGMDLSDHNMENIESRLTLIYDLARKHHCNPEHLLELQHSLEQQLEQLTTSDERIAKIQKLQETLETRYHDIAKKLTASRKKAAAALEKDIINLLHNMDMSNSAFKIDFEPTETALTPYGHEKIQFLIQTNIGQGFQPLHKIASGGELSRISLALHVLTANKEQTPTLIFDEADVGISGKTAAIVGKLLRSLGEKTQVLCITHLPQVACYGHHHYKATKYAYHGQTETSIQRLSAEQRTDEIARLLGGTHITQKSLDHAHELLSLSQ